MTSTALRASFALLRTRRFGTFWFATLLSNLGFWAQEVAEPWLLLSMGASPFLIGLDAFVGDAPAWLLTIPGGVLADRRDRRRVITIFQSVQLLCPLALIALILTGTVSAWAVIALSLVVGVTDALSMPSYQSIVPSIVTHDQIGTGLALSSTQYNLSRILGPACAGALIASVGVLGCFVVNALSYVPFVMVALWILPRGAPKPTPKVRGAVRAGLGAIARAPYLRGALILVFATSLLCGPLITFCPVLVRDGFAGSASEFSLAIGAFGVGGLLGAIVLLGADPRRDRRGLGVACAVANGAAVLCAGLTPWFAVLPAAALLAGLAMTVGNTTANTILQATTSPTLRGQTVSLYMLAMRGGMALGSLTTGGLAHVLDIRTALAIDGGLAILWGWWLGERGSPRRRPRERRRSTREDGLDHDQVAVAIEARLDHDRLGVRSVPVNR